MRTGLVSSSDPKENIVYVDLTVTSSSDSDINDSTIDLEVNSVGPTEEVADVVSLANANRLHHTIANEYDIGDMVWGKVKSHPWWPGQIYDESLVSVDISKNKHKGCVFVTFFGDRSYGWFDPAELLPFEPNFSEKSQQTSARTFLNAVEEALNEFSRRRILGLSCPCSDDPNFNVEEGHVAVNNEKDAPRLYQLSQIKKTRRDLFRPKETLSFMQRLALAPMNGQPLSIEFIKNKSAVLACRKVMDPSKGVQDQPSSHQQQAAPSVTTCAPRKVELPILLHNLRIFAIDPLNSSCSSQVQKAFMEYRSMVYQKSVFKAKQNEAHQPTTLLETADDDKTSSEGKRGPSDHPKGIKKKWKTIDGSENDDDAEESDSDLSLRASNYAVEESPTATQFDSNEQLINAGGSSSSAHSSLDLIGNNLPNFVMPQAQSHLSISTAPTSAAEQQVPGTSNEPQSMSEDVDIIEEAMRLRKRADDIMDKLNMRLREYEPSNI